MPSRTSASTPLGTTVSAHLACEPCSPPKRGRRAPCMQNERQHKAERGRARAVCRECSAAAKPRAPSSISRLYERQASKAAEGSGHNRRGSDAGRRGSPACAKHAVHATADARGLARAEPLAVPRTHGSTGVGTACQACFQSEEQRWPAEPRQRQAQPTQRACCSSSLHSTPTTQ